MKEGLKYALKILGTKDYFEAEILQKVEEKFGADVANEVIQKLFSYNYINDERTAKNYISYKLRAGYGTFYIKDKLFHRGYEVKAGEVEDIATTENIDFEEQIRKLAERYKDGKGDAEKRFLKCVSFLTGRGFPTGLCFSILKKGDFEK